MAESNKYGIDTIVIKSPKEESLRSALRKRNDQESERLNRYIDMPDLSRTKSSPLYEIVRRTVNVQSLNGFDVIKIPEIVPTKILFDQFNMLPGHPARSKSDTYYVDDENVLRTHDTVFWHYYLNQPSIKEKISNGDSFGAICFGKVYRKDEIDRSHMNVFHQIGGLYLAQDDKETVTPDKLKGILSEIARSIFGEDVNFRFYDHNFPYTDPSYEMEAEINGEWIEMLGSGLPRKSVLKNFGVTGYNGWAFGFGLERLAIASMSLPDIRLLWSSDKRVTKQLQLGQTYKKVSKFPPVLRDISFIVDEDFVLNDYFDAIRDVGGGYIEEVAKIDKYKNDEKFGVGKTSYTFRITYRHLDKTLTNEEVNKLHKKIEDMTTNDFNGEIREL
jgi:phenylalanyl-tRNA synthetase alpha chain